MITEFMNQGDLLTLLQKKAEITASQLMNLYRKIFYLFKKTLTLSSQYIFDYCFVGFFLVLIKSPRE